jgi:ATP-dependent DNA helicase RecG
VDQWDDLTFLNQAKVCVSGQITRAALILLGKDEAEHFLSPGLARITCVLEDAHGVEKDYQHFGPPMLLNVGAAFAKVRTLTYRYLSSTPLFPSEVTKYDEWVVREALHNCVAHQELTSPSPSLSLPGTATWFWCSFRTRPRRKTQCQNCFQCEGKQI